MRLILTICVMAIAMTSAWAYSESLAKEMTLYSSAAYASKPGGCPQANKGTVHAHFTAKIGKHDVSGYTLTDSSKIVLVFRGTNAFGQLVDEAVASSPVNYPYPATAKSLKVVKYFIGGYDKLRNSVVSSMKSLLASKSNHKVYITGHSLGGAMAALAAYDLVATGVVPSARLAAVYTLGQPRTGNYAFSQAYQKLIGSKSFRVVHSHDMVAHVPPCHTSFDIKKLANVCDKKAGLTWAHHSTTEVWYKDKMPSATSGSGGSFKTCTGSPTGEDYKCSNSLLLKTSIADHRNYFNVNVGGACAAKFFLDDPAEEARVVNFITEMQAAEKDREAELRRTYLEFGLEGLNPEDIYEPTLEDETPVDHVEFGEGDAPALFLPEQTLREQAPELYEP